MKKFSRLVQKFKFAANEDEKINYLKLYLNHAHPQDQNWVVYLLLQGKVSRIFSSRQICEQAKLICDFSDALYETCLDSTKDALETASLILPAPNKSSTTSISDWLQQIVAHSKLKDQKLKLDFISDAWRILQTQERYLFNKLITGNFQSPIESRVVLKVLAEFLSISTFQIQLNYQRFIGGKGVEILSHLSGDTVEKSLYPYPFAEEAILSETTELTPPHDYHILYYWPGLSVQWVRDESSYQIWDQSGNLFTDKFPEFEDFLDLIPPHSIIIGRCISKLKGEIGPYSLLEKRIHKKSISLKYRQDNPMFFCVYDILKWNSESLHMRSYAERFKLLDTFFSSLVENDFVTVAEEINVTKWEYLDQIWPEIKSNNCHALHLKPSDQLVSNWPDLSYILRAIPYRAIGVLLYVKRGEGALFNQYVEYTLAVRSGDRFIPFVKISVTFVDEELAALHSFIKTNTIERFGPVYSLQAELTFEIAFEAVEPSGRTKSGIKLLNPSFMTWHRYAALEDVNTLESLVQLIR